MSTDGKGKQMTFVMNYETEMPVYFCERVVDYVQTMAELECRIEDDTAYYEVIGITLVDYEGNYYEPSGEDFDMVTRMLRTNFDKSIRSAIWDQAEWEQDVIKGDKDWGIYA